MKIGNLAPPLNIGSILMGGSYLFVVNASLCPLLFFLLVLEATATGYISGFNAPGAGGEIIGSMVGVGLGTAVTALITASLASFYYLFRRRERKVPARVSITTIVMTLAMNAVLTIFFLAFLVGMHST
ncbi:hypothetical protein R6Y95_04435 [Methanoculleus palmolei]|jgi:hypothetical protein|uniref:Uncharacterized protein n=1 Tax=Methanoculleus palmolei TaxID=72612 RepID=A0ABD8AAR1_9EURY|nr:hypothetical protein R6Y95_04435 [Methanoculleus palmolei]